MTAPRNGETVPSSSNTAATAWLSLSRALQQQVFMHLGWGRVPAVAECVIDCAFELRAKARSQSGPRDRRFQPTSLA